jgi:hypothetical protein
VPAAEVSAILRDYGISLVFLEACQTVKAENDPTSSVASRLLQDGVSSVVAMSHTVLGETARRFIGAFYDKLVHGNRIGDAMLAGQRELKDDDFRGHAFKGELRLQDWFVPILFQEEDDPALVEAVLTDDDSGKNRADELRLAVGAVPEEPDQTFVGRSRELLVAERILACQCYVVLRGEGGEGKTTLAAELVRWLVRTRRFERAAFVSLEHAFEERVVLQTLGDQLVDNFASEAGQDKGRARNLVCARLCRDADGSRLRQHGDGPGVGRFDRQGAGARPGADASGRDTSRIHDAGAVAGPLRSASSRHQPPWSC